MKKDSLNDYNAHLYTQNMEAEKKKVLVAHKHSDKICEQVHSYDNEYINIKASV